MSSHVPDKNAIRDDIYENLPCQAMFNESVRKIKTNGEPMMIAPPNSSPQNVLASITRKNINLPPKEILYATPLRKSDRFKSKERSCPSDNNKSVNSRPDSVAIKEDLAQQSMASGRDPELEEKRILSFLKDTTQLHKKMELHRDFPNSNFSCLAREEHFANLVQQNVEMCDTKSYTSSLNDLELVEADQDENLRREHDKKSPTEKDLSRLMYTQKDPSPSSSRHSQSSSIQMNAKINREWVLKKIAMCLEQRIFKKPIPPPPCGSGGNDTSVVVVETPSGSSFFPRPSAGGANMPHLGCLVLGSNGSGKTSICRSILDGTTATRGILNRKLLGCYFVNSQNPECHSLSLFLRSLVLQILSHSSYVERDESASGDQDSMRDCQDLIQFDKVINELAKNGGDPLLLLSNGAINEMAVKIKPEDEEEMLISELKLNACVADFCAKKTSTIRNPMVRQKSEPTEPSIGIEEDPKNDGDGNNYKTHPPLKIIDKEEQKELFDGNSKCKDSPSRKISKIPVKISSTRTPKKSNDVMQTEADCVGENSNEKEVETDASDDQAVIEDGAQKPEEIAIEAISENGDQKTVDEIEENVENADENKNNGIKDDSDKEQHSVEKPDDKEQNFEEKEQDLVECANETALMEDPIPSAPSAEEISSSDNIPPPLPKPKNCRTLIADAFYEKLVANPEIFESLSVDNIEKNPDECFKKAILFPLLELCPPKTALLLLVDSIDENYINEGNLITTLKGRSSNNKSRNIAELLSNHIHLFPKWLFLVCTAKKQNKHITKMFNGFKKITLDDLRKSHVVKDVQEYIINRLNTDFKGTINLTKDVIESLNQLYIKSNGCILYLQKVLNGIKDNFFSFREIKLIPCTLNGLYLYICQKSFNKKQYMKIRPILNILLASSGFVDRQFVFNCLRTHNYTIELEEFDKRIDLMQNILVNDGDRVRIFHNSFCDWLVDVKFSTKKFLCDVNEGHVMISMYYTLISDELCPNKVRLFVYHLIKSGDYLTCKNVNMDLMLILLESRANLSDCFYTNLLNCCSICEDECKNDPNYLPKTRIMIERFLNSELNTEFASFLCDFFKPNLPTDAKTLKLLIDAGINNADTQLSYASSMNSPEPSEKSENIDSELAELLISSERTCQLVAGRKSPSEHSGDHRVAITESHDDISSTMRRFSDEHGIEMHKGKALIHILANEGNHLLLERALRACKDPIDLEIEDANGQTALNIASRNGHLDVVKLLLEFKQAISDGTGRVKGVDVNHADRDGWTPLRSASWGGHTEVVKLLIGHTGCAIDLADKEGRTALRAAAWSGHEDILKILIEAGANVNSVDKQGRTSLIAASYMGHYDIVELLLENGADVNHLDLDGRSALCVAALCGTSGYSKVISCLLEHGANTDQLDNDGMSPLLVSSFEGNAEVCELLLENGADPDLADFMGRTPLWAACTAGHASVVKLLLFWGCGIDCMDSEGRTVLSIAAAQGNLETVRQLLDRGLDETHRDNAGWTPLHYAAFEGYADICIQLLESGAKIDECDNEGKTALHLASQEGHNAVIEALLDIHSACVDIRAHDGKTAFRLACLEGHVEGVNTLLKYGCDVNSKDADSRTTLYILALENKLKVVKYLLEHSNIDVNIPDSEGRTALHVASWQGHAEMVRLLISKGRADVNAMDLECRTPLHSCAWQGNHEVMEILLFCGAVGDHACKQGATALGISAQEGHEQCVSILLQYGANPFKSDHCGRTPIKLAAKSNRNNVLRILESFTKNENSFEPPLKQHSSLVLKSPDKPLADKTSLSIHSTSNPNPNLLMPNNVNLNATGSTQSSNFYENTMHSDNSSLQKRKSVISSQSTGSSNEAPLSFTQQLQRQTRHNSRHSQIIQHSPVNSSKYKQPIKHSQVLPNVDEYHTQIAANIAPNEADLFDLGCMSPLYATPPHSPTSDLSSPGQHPPPSLHHFEEIGGHNQQNNQINADHHFARDTHMRIILGNANKEAQQGGKSSKRSGIATNPAMRMIRSRFDSAAQLIRRTNNMLSSNNQGSSSIGVKSGTFQWRKESQM